MLSQMSKDNRFFLSYVLPAVQWTEGVVLWMIRWRCT